MSYYDELVSQNVTSAEQLAKAIQIAPAQFGGDVDSALISLGVSADALIKIKSSYYNIPSKKVNPGELSSEVMQYIPEDTAKIYHFVPLGIVDGVLEVGITDPDNIGAVDALQFITSKSNIPYKLFLISQADFDNGIKGYQSVTGEVDQVLEGIDTEISDAVNDDSSSEVIIESANKNDNLSLEDEKRIVEDAPIIKIVAVIIRHGTEGGASDIHIENVGDKVKVRFRVDGTLHTSLILPLSVYNGVVARVKILAKLRLDEKRKPQDGSFSARIDGRKIDFRVSTMPTYYGEKVVMRILDSTKGVKPLEDLGFSEHNFSLVKEAIAAPYGLILITGPTGSGKTTTLYSMLNQVDRETQNVISLEDPVEYQVPGINQSQVHAEIGYTFANGLRSILRQDPDIIMVGEIRDKETAQLAVQAALTGHLVFSTLHTNSAVGAIPRLIDMGIDPYLLAPTLRLIIAQRLTRTICEGSKKKIPIDEAMRMMLNKQFADAPAAISSFVTNSREYYETIPSAECASGTRGRTPVFEMFKIDKAMQGVILKTPNEADIYKVARQAGMLSMREDAFMKNFQGIVPIQDVYDLSTGE